MLTQLATLVANHVLRSQAWARERLGAHAGSIIRWVMPPLRVSWVVNPDGTVAEAAAGGADVEMSLPPWAPWLVLRGADALARSARVSGSADLADTLAFVLRGLRWDYEEDLSHVIGDIPAHRLGALIRALARGPAQVADRLAASVAETLCEEERILVAQGSAGEFGGALDALRADLDRLEHRLARIAPGAK
ncbi:MAG: SCP2 sterol-binding domain-containing protein [Rhodocyclaceae bacterium]